MEEERRLADAAEAASAVIDTLRHLLSVLGCLLSSPAGQRAAQDAQELRSLPALGKALRRLWFDTHVGSTAWDSKEQAVWLCRLLASMEGSRAGLLSFYGAGLLLCDAIATFAEVVLGEAGLPLDEAWVESAMAVQEVLRGRHWEQLQQWPADRRCGGGSDPLLSTGRLPTTVRRVLDLEGTRLTKAQAVGLGLFIVVPGTMTVAMGGIGCALLLKTARDLSRPPPEVPPEADKWQAIQTSCLKQAHKLLRRKSCPIEIRYQGNFGPKEIKVTLYSVGDPFCALPVGSLKSFTGGTTTGEATARLRSGEHCVLRPPGDADNFRLRVYQPGTLLDTVLNDGVEVRRGDRMVIMPTVDAKVRCVAESPLVAGTGETSLELSPGRAESEGFNS